MILVWGSAGGDEGDDAFPAAVRKIMAMAGQEDEFDTVWPDSRP